MKDLQKYDHSLSSLVVAASLLIIFMFYPTALNIVFFVCLPPVLLLFLISKIRHDQRMIIHPFVLATFLLILFYALISLLLPYVPIQSTFFILIPLLYALIITDESLKSGNVVFVERMFLLFVVLSAIPLIWTAQGRYASYFENANTYGIVLNIALIFALRAFHDRKSVWLWGCLILFILFNLYLSLITGSRKTLLAGGLILLIYYLFFATRRLRTFLLSLLILGAAIAALIYFAEQLNLDSYLYRMNVLLEYFESGHVQEGSINERTQLAQRATELFLERPFLGWGLDAFRTVSGFNKYAHNNYLEMLANYGLLGFSVYYGAFLLFFYYLLRNFKETARADVFLYLSSFIFIIFIDFTIVTYYNMFILLLLAQLYIRKNATQLK